MQTVKEYLQLYRETRDISNRNRIESEAELECIKEIESSTHGTDAIRIRKQLAKLKYKALKLREREQEDEEICQKILNFINQLQGDKKEIFYKRYILGEKWEDIAGEIYLSLGRVQGIHRETLEELERSWQR